MLQLASAAGGVEKEMIIAAVVERQKKWDALDVVPMKMRQKDVRAQGLAVELFSKLLAQNAKTRAAIKDVDVAVDANFHTGSVAAVDRRPAGAGQLGTYILGPVQGDICRLGSLSGWRTRAAAAILVVGVML